jgi:hypothetical protein
MNRVVEALSRLSIAPSGGSTFNDWLEAADAIKFLRDNVDNDEFVVHVVSQHTFIHAVLVPASSVTPPNVEDLLSWNCNATSTWGVSITFSEPTAIAVTPPLDDTASKTLQAGEQLVFSRNFEGRTGDKHYYEASQKFAQVSGLHFLESRKAYCRLDKHGDVEDVIRIVEIPGKGQEFGLKIVTIQRAVLDEYLALTDSAIVRTFDFTRYRSSQFGGWSNRGDVRFASHDDLSYRSHVEAGHASYLRGFQIVRCSTSKESIIKRHDPSVDEGKQYASFLTHDWKNAAISEISCAPGFTANYFTKSDLPFELSPAFFRPEVLSKYKADSEKYRLEDRSISCRGTWHLQSYDINDAGQVHTYLVYLRSLPFDEQLHWKSHNERPKGPIAKRAFTTDFEGNWFSEYDPLSSLKQKIRELDHLQVAWWTLKSEKTLNQTHYPVTASADEWASEIMQLDQLVVEGFEAKSLRNTAKSLGRLPDPNFASVKLVEECLIGLGFSEPDAASIVAPLKTVHALRTKLKGHASGNEAETIKQQILGEHRNYKEHFRALCAQCDESIQMITEALKKLS